MRVSRTRFSKFCEAKPSFTSRASKTKRRLKRKTEFPIVAVVQKKRKSLWSQSQSFSMLRKETVPQPAFLENKQESQSTREAFSANLSDRQKRKEDISKPHSSLQKKKRLLNPQKKSRGTIDYKNIILLRNLITAEGKILPRRINKLTAKQQRSVQKAIKSARIMGLVPFINKTRPF